jgi:hypothetical protein
MNGYLKTGTPSTGNGNGYKMGGSDSANLSHNMILRNCLSFQNRGKGFDENNDRGSMTLENCTAFNNGTNYGMSGPIDQGSVMTLENCISAGSGSVSILPTAAQATNSWMPPFVVTNADFISVDTTGVRGPRNADGSLPTVPFLHLGSGSLLIDAGTNVGLPFLGAGPDLGAFEFDPSSDVDETDTVPHHLLLAQNYPNPCNPTTQIRFSVEKSGRATLVAYSILGQTIATLFDEIVESGHFYTVKFDGSKLASGAYIYRLQSDLQSESKRLLLLK